MPSIFGRITQDWVKPLILHIKEKGNDIFIEPEKLL
jgi:hypothetical protein